MIIREAMRADASAIAAAVIDQPLLVRYGSTQSGLTASIERGLDAGELVLVAEDFTGFAWLQPRGFLGLHAYLKLIATKTGAESRGVGGALLAAIEARVETAQLFLLVSDFNVDAQRFYARRGYLEQGRLPGLVKPDITEVVMARRLR